MDLLRLPEFFCAFKCHGDSSPILSPVDCAPQSWALAAFYCSFYWFIQEIQAFARPLETALAMAVKIS
jgi:glycogen debranching enzyme